LCPAVPITAAAVAIPISVAIQAYAEREEAAMAEEAVTAVEKGSPSAREEGSMPEQQARKEVASVIKFRYPTNGSAGKAVAGGN